MQSFRKFKPNASHIMGAVATALLLTGVACGTAATAIPAPTATPAPGPAVAQVATPTSTARPAAAPTATPITAATSPPAVNPGKLIWMTPAWGAGRFESVLGGSNTGNQFARIAHGFLIAADPSGQLIPGIAKDWSVSSDGKTWTVTVRDGARFHDGKPVTNKDVAWSWNHEWSPEALAYAKSATSLSQANNTVSIQVVGANQVSAVLKNGDGSFPAGILSEAGPNWIGSIYPARDKVSDDAASAAYDKAPIGAGPMKVVKQVPAELIAMERFDDFYYQPKNGLPEDRRVKFKSLDLRQVPEEATRVAAIRTGEADLAPVSLATRKQVEAGGGRLVFGPEGITSYPTFFGCWSPKQPPCKDKRVRQAFAYALDKKVIRDKLYGGADVFQVRGWVQVTPSSLGYSPDLDPYPFDPNKARQLLVDAGYPGGQGFGKFIINTYVSVALPFLPEQAQVAADTWHNELGIEVEVKIGDETALSAASRTDALWGQMTYGNQQGRYDGGSVLRSNYGTPESGARRHDDPELFAQVRAALAVTDPMARPGELNKIYKRLWDEQWDMAVGYVNIPWGVGPKVTAWQPFTFAFYPSGLHTITLK